MKRVGMVAAGLVIMASVFVGGFVSAGFGGDNALAQSEAQWSFIGAEFLCSECSISEFRSETELYELAEAGVPDGDMRIATNIIATLEQDGCEWQWVPGPNALAIQFRCG